MTSGFRAFRIHRVEDRIDGRFEHVTLDDLTAGAVVIRVRYSSINFKDALAATGRGAILRRFPLVGGIDLAGRVESSADPRWQPGDEVIVCGAGLSETRDGGYAEFARVPAEAVVRRPAGLGAREAMIIGTAGLTAAVAIDRLQRNGLAPGAAPVAVTGATGGVGSVAIDLLATLGYEVVAISGKPSATAYLEALGASSVLDRRTLEPSRKPLEAARFAGAIDNLGGDVLAWLLQRMRPDGSIASIGLAASPALATTVLPFILRGVSLLGINAVGLEPGYRAEVWARLGGEWRPRHLDRILEREVAFDELPAAFDDLIAGGVAGRRIVAVAPAF
jgi:NADPH2:quinone reductase